MSGRLPSLNARRILRALQKDGWYEVDSRSGHRQLAHPVKPGRVTVPYHGSNDVSRQTVRSIIQQAGLTAEEFRKLL